MNIGRRTFAFSAASLLAFPATAQEAWPARPVTLVVPYPILESKTSDIKEETKKIIREAIIERVEQLCKTKLNARNLFKSTNEFAISKINYYVGLVEFNMDEYIYMDDKIRDVLRSYKIHLQPGTLERLYLNRSKLGRGLECIPYRAERILLEMNEQLKKKSIYCNRKHAIIKSEERFGTQLSIIVPYLKKKYSLPDDLDIRPKDLLDAQEATLILKIEKKELHKQIFESWKDIQVDIKSSSK